MSIEFEDFLARHPEIEAVQLFITDPSGVARGKTASVGEFERLYRHGRPVAAGEPANLAVFDPSLEWTVSAADMASKSRNTPYAGRSVRGKVRHTVLHGTVTVVDGRATR